MSQDVAGIMGQVPGLFLGWGGLRHSPLGWLGLVLLLAGVGALVGAVASAVWCQQGKGSDCGLRKWLTVCVVGLLLAAVGVPLLVFGSHLPETGWTALDGAVVREFAGPPDAPLGVLVLVGGYGSESPVLAEPALFRQDAVSPAADTAAARVARLYRLRVVVHPRGGLGWFDWRRNAAVSASLDRYLEERRRAPGWPADRPCLVAAHSRGCQLVVGTPFFRRPEWRRFAVHPPAGVQPTSRLFAWLSPEITEIHRFGREWALAPADASVRRFPWTALFQAKNWDHTVLEFAPDSGLPLRFLSPAGTHVQPFAKPDTPVWRALAAAADSDAAGAARKAITPPPANPRGTL